MNADDQYIYDERLALLCGSDEPTETQKAIAWGDVVRFRDEQKGQNDN